jgi:hypothetical protein
MELVSGSPTEMELRELPPRYPTGAYPGRAQDVRLDAANKAANVTDTAVLVFIDGSRTRIRRFSCSWLARFLRIQPTSGAINRPTITPRNH